MKSLLLRLLPVVCLTSCATLTPLAKPSQRVLSPNPIAEGYVVGHTDEAGGVLANEFVQSGDSIGNWERLVSRMYFPQRGQAEMMARLTASKIKSECPAAKTRVWSSGPRAFSVEYSHNGCGRWEGHRRIRTFINGRDGTYMIAFDMKNRAHKAGEYAAWRSKILAATLSP
jgi:hypothetical protein